MRCIAESKQSKVDILIDCAELEGWKKGLFGRKNSKTRH
jgi:hypothetical protein